MDLYLVRHGESEANTAKAVTGTVDDALTPKGAAQMKALGRALRLSPLRFSKHFVSPWRRAIQSATQLIPDLVFKIDNRLGETNAGDVANWPLERFHESFPEFWNDFRPERSYPGGESHRDLYDRSVAWFDELISITPPDEKILAVCHTGSITCILQHALDIGINGFPRFLPRHASISIVSTEGRCSRLRAFSLTPIAEFCL